MDEEVEVPLQPEGRNRVQAQNQFRYGSLIHGNAVQLRLRLEMESSLPFG